MLVRPPHTIPIFLPSSRSTLSLPRRNPSPVADSTTTEIIPQRIPNIVRKLRSLLARRFWTDWMRASRIVSIALRRQDHLVAGLEAVDDLNFRAVADANLDRHLLASRLGAGRGDVYERALLRVVGDGGLGQDQRVRVFLEDDLGVRRHVR